MAGNYSRISRAVGWLSSNEPRSTRRPRWQRWVTSTFAQTIAGVALAGLVTVWQVEKQIEAGRHQQQEQFEDNAKQQAETARLAREQQASTEEVDRDLAVRAVRRPVYNAFLSAISDWASDQESRAENCVRGTDRPKPGRKCTIGFLSDLQSTRFALRGATNSMYTVQSKAGEDALVLLLSALPSAAPHEPGPYEGRPKRYYGEAYVLFLDQMACDTNPTPDGELCSETATAVDDAIVGYLGG